MCEFSANVAFNKLDLSKLDLCEGGSFSAAISDSSDIQQKYFFSFSCFMSVYPFVALLMATYTENSHNCFV